MGVTLCTATVFAIGKNNAIICNVTKTASILLPTQFHTRLSLYSASKRNKPHHISHAPRGIFISHIKYGAGFMPFLQMYALPHLSLISHLIYPSSGAATV